MVGIAIISMVTPPHSAIGRADVGRALHELPYDEVSAFRHA
jgi:hypothetical protein